MKKLLSIILSAFMLILFADLAVAQQPVIKFKFGKIKVNVKKEARRLKKQGWTNVQGELPLDAQLAKKFALAEEVDEKGLPKWFVSEQTATMDIESAAKNSALTYAKIELTRLLESTVNGLIETDFGGQETGKDEGVGLSKSLGAASELFSKELGMLKPVSTLVKENKDGYTYRVAIAYNFELAMEMYKKQLRLTMADESKEVRGKMEKLLMKELSSDNVINYSQPDQPAE